MQWMSAPNIAGAPLPQRARGFWKAQLSAAFAAVERVLEAERAQLPPWLVIGFGSGIAGWFALGEPRQWAALIAIALALALLGFLLLAGRVGRALGWFALAAALGCALVWARSVSVAAPRLDWPKVVSVTGRIEQVELLTAKGQVRLTIAPDSKELPRRIRVSFRPGWRPRRACSGFPGLASRPPRAAAANGPARNL